jgi:hypothetical protein
VLANNLILHGYAKLQSGFVSLDQTVNRLLFW